MADLGEIAKKVDFAALPPEERAAWAKVLTVLENLRENRRRASRIRTLAAFGEAEKRKLERLHRLRVPLLFIPGLAVLVTEYHPVPNAEGDLARPPCRSVKRGRRGTGFVAPAMVASGA
ncbi:hypothetical protein ACIBIZ_14795 [Nonomuraea spiralis]|uniref:hypothetical protein n=1 Tax=Nonomuraea spiralis TaxID=46182 RepID=UPI00379541CD